ncbi:hypothetical protein [Kitasatospora phosalacinea]|uniref:Uncharacterized protein n=1 Tax=Kitasatospora phosalacinea TaxID=2065 RepID=A0A9W6PN40_9ACTN|nr:hypothetical protein [Kitasatospora phosalacinea]GLW58022.1 hypothetical protein Kpho01_60330 [Kitasatospora phosalacinea]
MSDATALDHADAMIEKAWGQPITELEQAAAREPVEDPLLRAAMRTREHLTVLDNSAVVLQSRLHALTRPGRVPAFYELDRITDTAGSLRTAYAEASTALKAIRTLATARRHTLAADDLAAERVRAATARTAPSRPLGLAADRPAPPVPAAPVLGATNRR